MPPRVRGEICERSRKSSGRVSVRAESRQKPSEFILPGIRKVQDIINATLHLGARVLLEETARARRAKGDGVQRLRDTVVQLTRDASSFLEHRGPGGACGMNGLAGARSRMTAARLG